MKSVLKEDLGRMNCMVMELPPFIDLKSRPMIRETLDTFLEDLYIKQPQELFDTFNFKLSQKMQEVFYVNYGIDRSYSDRIIEYIKPDLAFALEKLFQSKGSNNLFKILANLFESVFHRINFYNIVVYKKPFNNDYDFEYRLRPLYITDPDTIITEPEENIGKSRKYLMDLINFSDYTVWPVPTNLIYIQFSIGTDLINNLQTFLHGIRAYAATYLRGQIFKYKSEVGIVEEWDAGDAELIVTFFRLNMLKQTNPDWEVDDMLVNGSYLPFFKPSEATIEDPEEAIAHFTPDVNGDYRIKLTVTDENDRSSIKEFDIRSVYKNSVPIADAGKDLIVDRGITVQLAGNKSIDSDNDELTYRWTITRKPNTSQAQLKNPNTKFPSFTADKSGVYEVELVVNDGTVDSDPDYITIRVPYYNSDPISIINAPSIVRTDTIVNLDGSYSYNPYNTELIYEWSLLEKPHASIANIDDPQNKLTFFTADVDGTYKIKLQVTTNNNKTSFEIFEIHSVTSGQELIAEAGINRSVNKGVTISLTGSNLGYLPENQIRYNWELIEKPTGSQADLIDDNQKRPNFTTDKIGQYKIKLILKNIDGTSESEPDYVFIQVPFADYIPVAIINAPTEAQPNQTITLDASNSYDPEGETLAYKWTLIRKPIGSTVDIIIPDGVQSNLTPDLVGTYIVQLETFDSHNWSSPAQIEIRVIQPNSPPVIDLDYSYIFKTGSRVDLDASNSYGANNSTLTFDWELIHKPSGSTSRDKCDFMQNMAILFKDYSDADYSKRIEMENLRRRWQMFLREQETNTVCYSTLDELNNIINSKYPRLYEDFFRNRDSNDKNHICAFFITVYSVFLNGAYSSFIQPENKKCFNDLIVERDVIKYQWRLNGRVVADTKDFTYVFDEAGTYSLLLIVTNEDLHEARDAMVIEVTDDPPSGPIADAGTDKYAQVGRPITLVGTGIPETGVPITRYLWKQNGQVISSSPTVEYIPTSIGYDELTFSVIDDNGNYDTDGIKITVSKSAPPETTYPIANAGYNKKAQVGVPVTISGSAEDLQSIKIHDTDWIITYLDVIFGGLFLNQNFLNQFFDPVMDLFSKYFFPVEMDYITDLMNRSKIKDKWNSVSTESKAHSQVIARHTSIQTPIRGIDWAETSIHLAKWHSYVNHFDSHQSHITHYLTEPRINVLEGSLTRELTSRHTDNNLILDDTFEVEIFEASSPP